MSSIWTEIGDMFQHMAKIKPEGTVAQTTLHLRGGASFIVGIVAPSSNLLGSLSRGLTKGGA
jgi:hypothetical protein